MESIYWAHSVNLSSKQEPMDLPGIDSYFAEMLLVVADHWQYFLFN